MPPKSAKSPSRSKLEKKLLAAETRAEELASEVAVLRSRVLDLQAESASWRKKAVKQKSRVHQVRAKAEIAIAEATKVARKRADKRAKARIRQVIADHPRAEPLALSEAPPLPEPSWTVTRLRVAAREQGVVGYGRMRKVELLEALI